MNYLRNLDRRLIFLIMGLAVAIPILLRFVPPSQVTLMDQNVFNAIEDLPDGSVGPSLYCTVIVKRVDEKTRSKTSINDLLRD